MVLAQDIPEFDDDDVIDQGNEQYTATYSDVIMDDLVHITPFSPSLSLSLSFSLPPPLSLLPTHTSVNNPVITIDQQTLTDQVASLGTPVTNTLNSPAFSQVAPLGLVIPEAGGPGVPGNNGAATMSLTITSLSLMLLASIIAVV